MLSNHIQIVSNVIFQAQNIQICMKLLQNLILIPNLILLFKLFLSIYSIGGNNFMNISNFSDFLKYYTIIENQNRKTLIEMIGMKGFQTKFRSKLKGIQRRDDLKSGDSSPYSKENMEPIEQSVRMDHTIQKLNGVLENFTKMFSSFTQIPKKNSLSFENRFSENSSMNVELNSINWAESQKRQHLNPDLATISNNRKPSLGYGDEKNQGRKAPPDQLSQQMLKNMIQKIQEEDQLKMEQRFRLIKVEIPILKGTNFEEKKQEIFDWLSIICKKIFSTSFQLLLNGSLNTKSTKDYCSENLLYRIIQLIKANSLNNQDIKQINIFLKTVLLPYYELKYPQSESNQVSLRLSNKLAKIDNYFNNSNDLVFRSGAEFQYSEKGDYNQQIMTVLNSIINLPNKIGEYEIKNVEQEAKQKEIVTKIQQSKILKNFLQKKKTKQQLSDQNDFNKSIDKDDEIQSNIEEMTLYSVFSRDMESLFKNVEDEDEFIRMKQSLSPVQFFHKYGITQRNQSKKQLYKEKVKQYTKYTIGRKVNQSIQQYTQQQIKSRNLVVKNSQILRILNKWCNHLKDKFQFVEQIIQNREQPFRMQDGSQNYLPKTSRILLSKLVRREEKNIEKFIQKVMENNYAFQQIMGKRQLPKKMSWFSSEQSTIGMFTSGLFFNNQNYILGYLNTLIHSLLTISNDFNDVIQFQTEIIGPKQKQKSLTKKLAQKMDKLCHDEIDVDQFMKFVKDKLAKGTNLKIINYESIPQLVTFMIGDLMRCKCSSKQAEITAIYKEIMRISNLPDSLWKVIRIKNRLNKGTKDILINVTYRKKVLAEIQLQVDEAKSKFITCSSSFKHYLYELQRAQFGPISEMSNIWMNNDYRAEFYRNQHLKMNERKPLQGRQHICEKQIIIEEKNDSQIGYQPQIFPFVCCLCEKLWTSTNLIKQHSFCNYCQKTICGYCKIETHRDILEPSFRAAIEGIYALDRPIQFISNQIPNQGAMIKLYARDTVVKKFKLIQYEYKKYLFEILPKQKYSLMLEINTESEKQFLQQHIVISLEAEQKIKNQNIIKINKQNNIKIAQEYFLPNQFDIIVKEKKSSILLEKKNIKDQNLINLEKCQEVTKVNFSENQLEDMNLITDKFPNTSIMVMANNKFKSISKSINSFSQSLVYLDLSYNQIKQLPNQFSDLKNLTFFNLGHNIIHSLPNNIDSLTNLKVMIMGHNKIKSFEQFPPNIKKIDLQHNLLESLSFQGLGELVILNLSFNKLQQLKNLKEAGKLKSLDISNNEFKSFHFTGMKDLQRLNASHNKATEIIIQYDDGPESSKLKLVNLSFNKFISFPDKFYENIQNVNTLILTNNFITSVTKGIFHLHRVEQLNLSSIRQRIGKKKTKEKEINQTFIEPILPDDTYNHLLSLLTLDLSNNGLSQIPSSLSKMGYLRELDMSSNSIRKLDIILSIESLDLSKNKISEFTAETAKNFSTLKILNLRNNKKLTQINSSEIKAIIKDLTEIQWDGLVKGSQRSMSSRGKMSDNSGSDPESSDNQEENNQNGGNQKKNRNSIQLVEQKIAKPRINHLHQKPINKIKQLGQMEEPIVEQVDKQNME